MKTRRGEDGWEYPERRKKTDWVTRAASILSAAAWTAAMVVLIFLDRARPNTANFFTRLLGYTVHSTWNNSLLRTSFILLIVSFCICAVAMIFNMMRSRRKTDKYKKSIIILGIMTLVAIAAFLIVFGEYL